MGNGCSKGDVRHLSRSISERRVPAAEAPPAPLDIGGSAAAMPRTLRPRGGHDPAGPAPGIRALPARAHFRSVCQLCDPHTAIAAATQLFHSGRVKAWRLRRPDHHGGNYT
jgi:hypothetical protein